MLTAVGSFLVRLLWPECCVACHAPVSEGRVFCAECELSVVPLEVACPRCAMPAAPRATLTMALAAAAAAVAVGSAEVCPACLARPFPFEQARASFVYGGAVADAIVGFKHGTALAPARSLGRCLVPVLDWAAHEAVDALLPVPLHPRRLRERGFNQSLELLREANLLRTAGLPVRRLPVWVDTLRRHRDTESLGHHSPPVRRSRVSGAFHVPAPARVRDRRLLVVDDVMTSGATLAECALTLREAGAAQVLVAALARAV